MTQHTKDIGPEEEQPGGNPGENDPLEASIAQISLSAGKEEFTGEEKAALWSRIQGSMEEKKPVYRRLGWQVAAAVAAVLLTAGWWMLFQQPTEEGILTYAQQQNISDTTTETRLMLGNNRQVTLSGANATLKYNQQGVLVNNKQQVKQESNGEETQYNTLIVPYGRRAHITMEDGTVAWLNAGSRLIYPVVFDGLKREVYLEGEAYFDVSQRAGVPFFVYTNHLRTAVLGTGFNVSAYPDDREQSVVLVNGNVKVKANNSNKEQFLSPGDKAGFTLSDQQLSKLVVNTMEYTAWKDGRLLFEHAPLNHIIKKLSRYFNIHITLDTNEQATFSGDLDLADNVETVLDAVSASTGLNYKRTQEGIIFKK